MFMLLLISTLLHMATTPVAVSVTPTPVMNSVRKLVCPITDDESAQGSATVIGKNMVLTDYHVTHERIGPCVFNGGSPDVRVLYSNPDEDIAVLAVDTGDLQPVPISCKGMVPGKEYSALGYPGSMNNGYTAKLVVTGTFPNLTFSTVIEADPPVLFVQKLVATGLYSDYPASPAYPYVSHHLTLMLEGVYQGMSGGPILNDRDEIVGLVTSKYGENSANRDLSGTGLCR